MRRGWSIPRVLGLIVGVALALGLVAALVARWTVKRATDGSLARQAAALAKHHQAFLEDQRLAATLRVLARRSGARDAGPVIGPRVGWLYPNPGAREAYLQSLPEGARGLELPTELLDQLGASWLDASPALWKGLDFAWMAGLADYDFWELDRSGPAPLAAAPFDKPAPNAVKLSAWAQLRLAKGLHDGDAPAAIREVEELARLCLSTEEVGAIAMGLGLLDHADRARARRGGASGAADLGPALPPGALGRLHRALFGALGHAELRASPAADADWDQVVLGRCAALASSLTVAITTRPLLRPAHRAEYQRLGRLLAAAPECRLARLREAWAKADAPGAEQLLGGRSWTERAIRWVPGGRTLAGEILLAISEQEWFWRYEKGEASTPGEAGPSREPPRQAPR